MRWLSIEAMKDNLYSSKSDVWAFAIVLWEIGTLGKDSKSYYSEGGKVGEITKKNVIEVDRRFFVASRA